MFTFGFQSNVFSDVCIKRFFYVSKWNQIFGKYINICLQITFFRDVFLNVALTF